MANPRDVRRNLFDTRESHSKTSDAQSPPASHHRRLSSYGPQESRISLADTTGSFVNPYDSLGSRVSLNERRGSWISFEEPNESYVSLMDHRRVRSYDTQDSRTSSEFNPYKLVEPSGSSNPWFNPYEQHDSSVSFLADADRRASAEIPDFLGPSSSTRPIRPRTISASSFRRSWQGSTDTSAIAGRPTKPPHSRRTVRRSLPSRRPTLPSNPPFVRERLNSAPTFERRVSEESRALSMQRLPGVSPRGSMILYRHAGSTSTLGGGDVPPLNVRPRMPRESIASNFSRDSFISISSDSKYPTSSTNSQGLIAYAYDPLSEEARDELEVSEEDELLLSPKKKDTRNISVIGFFNILTLIAMMLVMLTIFVLYPIIIHHHDNTRNTLIADNNMVNSSGQVTFALPGQAPNASNFVDAASPQSAFSFVGTDNYTYDLVFSDEFTMAGATFGGTPGTVSTDDPAYLARLDDHSFAQEITTKNGSVIFQIDVSDTPGQFISGVLDSQRPFCLGRGFVEMGLQLSNGTAGKLFWAGDKWYHVDSAPDNFVPSIPDEDVTLSLSFGILANTIPNDTPKDQLPSPVAVDFVRYYDRRMNIPGETPDFCDVKKSVKKQTTLNLLNFPELQG